MYNIIKSAPNALKKINNFPSRPTLRRGNIRPAPAPETAPAVDVAAAIDRYNRAFRNSPGERYLTEVRGIKIFDDATGTTDKGLDRFHFGFTPSYGYKGDARVIIPSTYPEITDPKFLTAEARRLIHNPPYFKARSIRPDCEARFKILINDGGHHATYPGNWPEELDATGESLPAPCVVVEGEIDALSIKAIDPDGKAISMGNAHRRDGFVADLLALRRLGVPIRPLWLVADEDRNGTGFKAMAELAALLDTNGFLCCWKGSYRAPRELDLTRDTLYKDINEFLVKDRAELTKRYIDGSVVATDFVKLWPIN